MVEDEINKCKNNLNYFYQKYYHFWINSNLKIEEAIRDSISKYGLQLSITL